METRALDYVRYADDFVALCDSEAEARKAADALEAFLERELKLSVKPTKTTFVSVEEGFEFLGFSFRGPAVRIPEARLDESRLSLRALLQAGMPTAESLRFLDAYVRGFRNYFDLSSAVTTEALRALEMERVDLLRKWATGRRLDTSLVLAQTERFVVEEQPARAPGAYGEERTNTDNEYALPPRPAPAQVTSLASVDRRSPAVLERAGHRPAAVNAAGHISIFGYGAVASLEQDRMVLRRKRNVVFEAPIEAMRTLQVDSYGIVVTTPLLERLAEYDVPLLFARHGERPWAVLRPLTARGSGDLLGSQVAARSGPLAILVAQELIGAKLANQERLLRYYAKYSRRRTAPEGVLLREGADCIVSLSQGLPQVDNGDVDAARRKVFSVEGRAGAAYWSALRAVLSSDFKRVGRGAVDPINAALNYGYGILYAAVWGAIGRAGLEPGIGMLHASPGDRGALVFDLVEPFRVPVVDRPVIGLISRGKVLKLNTDGHLTAGARRHVAAAVGQALDRKVPWDGSEQSLAGHIEEHARSLAVWLQGGEPLRALRIRW